MTFSTKNILNYFNKSVLQVIRLELEIMVTFTLGLVSVIAETPLIHILAYRVCLCFAYKFPVFSGILIKKLAIIYDHYTIKHQC